MNAALRFGKIVTLWLALGLMLYVVWWALIGFANPGTPPMPLAEGAPYLTKILPAMLLPGALHLLAPRHAWMWSFVFLIGSIVVPIMTYTRVSAVSYEYAQRGVHLDGLGIWATFIFTELFVLYGIVAAFALALLPQQRTGAFGYPNARYLAAISASFFFLHAAFMATLLRW